MKAIFIDTDVILDVLLKRPPHDQFSVQLFDLAEKGKLKLFVSPLSYSNIYDIVRKLTTPKKALTLLNYLNQLVFTLTVDAKVINHSLVSNFKDFEDAIQHNTVIRERTITAIITRNIKDFTKSELPVFTPESYLKTLES